MAKNKQIKEKRRPGAPEGNLNRAISILPALKRLKTGKPLPPKLERITAIASKERDELISDRGGWEHMSGAERLMVGNWASARKAELLIWHELLERGAIQAENGTWDLQPGLQRLSGFLMAQHRALVALGLERRQKAAIDLQSYIAGEDA